MHSGCCQPSCLVQREQRSGYHSLLKLSIDSWSCSRLLVTLTSLWKSVFTQCAITRTFNGQALACWLIKRDSMKGQVCRTLCTWVEQTQQVYGQEPSKKTLSGFRDTILWSTLHVSYELWSNTCTRHLHCLLVPQVGLLHRFIRSVIKLSCNVYICEICWILCSILCWLVQFVWHSIFEPQPSIKNIRFTVYM